MKSNNESRNTFNVKLKVSLIRTIICRLTGKHVWYGIRIYRLARVSDNILGCACGNWLANSSSTMTERWTKRG